MNVKRFLVDVGIDGFFRSFHICIGKFCLLKIGMSVMDIDMQSQTFAEFHVRVILFRL